MFKLLQSSHVMFYFLVNIFLSYLQGYACHVLTLHNSMLNANVATGTERLLVTINFPLYSAICMKTRKDGENKYG